MPSETRDHVIARYIPRPPKTGIAVIRCPFCETNTVTTVRKLAGAGARCRCGARHHPWCSTRLVGSETGYG